MLTGKGLSKDKSPLKTKNHRGCLKTKNDLLDYPLFFEFVYIMT